MNCIHPGTYFDTPADATATADRIADALASGRSICITNYALRVSITPKLAKAWVPHGGVIFASGTDLRMRRGKRSEVITTCAVHAV